MTHLKWYKPWFLPHRNNVYFGHGISTMCNITFFSFLFLENFVRQVRQHVTAVQLVGDTAMLWHLWGYIVRAWLLPFEFCINNKIMVLHIKVLHNICLTKLHLSKFLDIPNNCTFCKTNHNHWYIYYSIAQINLHFGPCWKNMLYVRLNIKWNLIIINLLSLIYII